MLDFGDMDRQQEINYGPVPGGSAVLLRLNLEKPKFAHERNEYISKAKSGLYSLYCKFTVEAGRYSGVSFRQNIWLPPQWQEVEMTDGQRKCATIGGAQLRAILESARGIDPDDDSPKAKAARQLSAFYDFDGLLIAAKLKIAKDPYVAADGREFWNNELSVVITPDKPLYAKIIKGGEAINELGPVTGDGTPTQQTAQSIPEGATTPDPFGPADANIDSFGPADATGTDKVPF